MDVAKLKGKIRERELTQNEVAKAIDIAPSTFARKLKTGEDFSIKEVNSLVDVLRIDSSEAIKIFLPTLSQ